MTWPLTVRRRVRALVEQVAGARLDGAPAGLAAEAQSLLPRLRLEVPSLRLARPPKVATLDRSEGARARRRRIYAEVMLRDGGACTAPGFLGVSCSGVPEIDHVWGRGREPESVENCRILCTRHHRMKTDSEPNRVAWLEQYRIHVGRFGHEEEMVKADRALALEYGQHPESV